MAVSNEGGRDPSEVLARNSSGATERSKKKLTVVAVANFLLVGVELVSTFIGE